MPCGGGAGAAASLKSNDRRAPGSDPEPAPGCGPMGVSGMLAALAAFPDKKQLGKGI